jgi:uroporphyrinogen-III synthase
MLWDMPGIRRVAVTRDEDSDGPLSAALLDAGFEPGLCRVATEAPPVDSGPLVDAARHLDGYDWIVLASQRAVRAISQARDGRPWPRGVRTAAVGARTANALVSAGADPAPFVAREAGADALWAALAVQDSWTGRRVLVPAVEGGRRSIIDGLRVAGAVVTVVEPYRMLPRAPEDIAADWTAFRPDAVVLASPSTAERLVCAIGRDALTALHAVVAIGGTTADALRDLGVTATVPADADFISIARHLASLATARRPGAVSSADTANG